MVLVLAAFAAGTRGAVAQQVLQPEAKLDPAQSVVRDALYRLRDSLLLVEAGSARIQRDLAGASDAALRSRARVLAGRCTAATVQLDSSRAVVAAQALPDPDPRAARAALDKALATLRPALVQCASQFTELTQPAKADELRGYGIGRAKRVRDAIRDYRPSASRYFRLTFNQQYWPNITGAGATPSAH
jgi:hypothetical protein